MKVSEITESNPFTNARMNAIKAGKDSFTVNDKKYKITGDTKDEREAVEREAADKNARESKK